MQAASAVSVVAIIEQMGLADHETKVANTLVDAGCEDTVPLSDTLKHLRDDAGVSTGHAIALEDALATEGLSLQVIVCTHACIMLPMLQSFAVAVFSDHQCACCCRRFSDGRCFANFASSAH
jgi:hypothetical protein